MRLRKKSQNNILKWFVFLFFIATSLYAADEALNSYLKEVGQITTDVQIIMNQVGMNSALVEWGKGKLQANIQKFHNLKPPKEFKRYHMLMFSAMNKFKVALWYISKGNNEASRSEVKLGALLFKKAAEGYRQLAKDKGYAKEVKQDEAVK